MECKGSHMWETVVHLQLNLEEYAVHMAPFNTVSLKKTPEIVTNEMWDCLYCLV